MVLLSYAVGAGIWFLIKYLRQRRREREERERQREREEREHQRRRAAFMTGLWWPSG
jgi:threonine/homoserine/homoserine lactone efflux protein